MKKIVYGAEAIENELLHIAKDVLGKPAVSTILHNAAKMVITRAIALAPNWGMHGYPGVPRIHRVLRAIMGTKSKEPLALAAASHRASPVVMWADRGTYGSHVGGYSKRSRPGNSSHAGTPALEFFERAWNQMKGEIIPYITQRLADRLNQVKPVGTRFNPNDDRGWIG